MYKKSLNGYCRRARAPIDTTIEMEGVRIGVQLTNGIRLLD
jgi:hypothetical protein